MNVAVNTPPQHRSQWARVRPRRPILAGLGRLRKIAFLGGAQTLKYAPWHDPTWELWAHVSCRHHCGREPDLFFDLHPPDLWRDPKKKIWDKNYVPWLQQNHVPICMQERYVDVPASIRYPFEQMITEFPRGYMTNTVAYMMALALMEGVTHIGIFGCHYSTGTEYGPQRGCAEYWCGVAEGRGVQVLIPPLCDLLNKPHLLYGYASHPGGKRDPSYTFLMGPKKMLTEEEQRENMTKQQPDEPTPLTKGGDQIPLRKLEEPPALDRADVFDPVELRRLHDIRLYGNSSPV